MKILIRLPNWLGDLVMSAPFIEQVQNMYPGCEISIIIKKGLETVTDLLPEIKNRFIFSKQEYDGLTGVYRFGKKIKAQEKFDLYFSLPDSFSSALMGYATGAEKRVGYRKELRSLLLTNAYTKNKEQHRVQQYLDLLRFFSGKQIQQQGLLLGSSSERKNNIVININSEASSRRLPKEKAISIIEEVRKKTNKDIILIGSPNEKQFVDEVFNSLTDKTNIQNIAGQTSLSQLTGIFLKAETVLTTDSGPAHLANALGAGTVILFGAGDENETAPYNPENRTIIRLGKLPCEPCRDNLCKIYGIPKCLTSLSVDLITNEVINAYNEI